MATSNPAFGPKTFENLGAAAGSDQAMSLQGTVNKILILLTLALVAAVPTWKLGLGGDLSFAALTGAASAIGVLGGLVVAFVIVFKKSWAPVLAPIYALFEGFALGGISAQAETEFSGIVAQALALTGGTLLFLLLIYKSRLIVVDEKLKIAVFAATAAIGLFYLASFVLRLVGISTGHLFENGLFGIAISLFIVAAAAFNLILDFDYIEEGVAKGAPRYMEWYLAFGLMVTLVWLYIEMLRLLLKIRRYNSQSTA